MQSDEYHSDEFQQTLLFQSKTGSVVKSSLAGKADFLTKFGTGNITYDFSEAAVKVYFDSKEAISLNWPEIKHQMKEITAQGWSFYNGKARWGNL